MRASEFLRLRIWVSNGLLAGSWMLGTGWLEPAKPLAWAGALVMAVGLLSGVPVRVPPGWQSWASVLLGLPAIWILEIPYGVIPLLLVAGLVLASAAIPRRWPQRLGQGALAASAILLGQAMTLECYAHLTARRHLLPEALAEAAGGLARVWGLESTVDTGHLVIHTGERTVRLGLTWDLLLDPASACFFSGGLIVLFVIARGQLGREGTGKWMLRGSLLLVAVTSTWCFLRLAWMVAVVTQRLIRADAVSVVNAGSVLVSTWLHVLPVVALGALTAVVGRTVLPASQQPRAGGSPGRPGGPARGRGRAALPAVCVAAAVALSCVVLHWQPVGRPKAGRILVMEKHSSWEPTTTPYNTTSYGESGSYNYGAMYTYCGQFYRMSRLPQSADITDAALASCDVLVIKTPTARYVPREIDAIARFVRNGGSLLLIGDHTNVFNMNTYLNDIARRFGFAFRHDLLFQIGEPYRQRCPSPRVPHPVLQRVSSLDFAVSCSVDPGASLGTMVIRSTGLWSLPPAYHESNYHPQAEYRTDMHYGAWCQLWATTAGRGRVLAFTDSTLFSNFCFYQPGKADLLLGMLSWLNHASAWDAPVRRVVLRAGGLCVAVGLLMFAVWFGGRRAASWVFLVATALGMWSVTGEAVKVVHRQALTQPTRQYGRLPQVMLDRVLSSVPLATGAFADGPPEASYGLLEQWIPRMGCAVSRESDLRAMAGKDGLVIIAPTRSVSDRYREVLRDYVRRGGRVLVLDSPEFPGSSANSLLNMFGLAALLSTQPVSGELDIPALHGAGGVTVSAARVIEGGQPLAFCGQAPVAAQVSLGEGKLTAVGFASLFNDRNMGEHWLVEPDAATQARYAALYALLGQAFDLEPQVGADEP
jgi:hypothetical protein